MSELLKRHHAEGYEFIVRDGMDESDRVKNRRMYTTKTAALAAVDKAFPRWLGCRVEVWRESRGYERLIKAVVLGWSITREVDVDCPAQCSVERHGGRGPACPVCLPDYNAA